MLEAKIDVQYFIQIVESLKNIVNEVYLKFSKQGMTIQSMDPAHISFIHLFMEKDGFDTYKCPRAIKSGVDLESFGTILRLAKSPFDKLTMVINSHKSLDIAKSQVETDYMQISIEDEHSKRMIDFEMKLIKFEESEFKVPQVKSERLLCMRSSDFASICRDLQNISEDVLLKFIKNGISLSVESDIANGNIKIKDNDTMENDEETKESKGRKSKESKNKSEIKLISAVEEGSLNVAHLLKSHNIGEEKDQQFSLKYLNSFNKGEIFNPIVKIHLSSNKGKNSNDPMLIEFKIGDCGVMKYYLAPKIQD